ncbi:MAG TPA: Eco57I restriction-modification methylase domain-containing protein [Candidatus Binatus sp.]|jgi:adenine-specific DNA-methyltransferase|nr:Eco57I restriction-modification methylase domain-containing protein [Candidatus Binatus sp.]
MKTFTQLESERVALQELCDTAKTQGERNRLGQFATPPALALDILKLAKRMIRTSGKVHFLDPAFGTGSFFSALLSAFPAGQIGGAVGFEIDRHYGDKSRSLWGETQLDLRITDFTKAPPPEDREKFDLVVCNPPYVRHHHLTALEKGRLRQLTRGLSGLRLSGLTGLYCYFLILADAWASDDAVCVWLIPSEFMDVNYGVAVKEYLLTRVTLLQVHRFEAQDVQFGDAIVSSSVVCFRKAPPPANHVVDFTFGGSLNDPKSLRKTPLASLRPESKWNGRSSPPAADFQDAKLSDIFEIKRGLATGDNSFFILTQAKIKEHRLPMKFLRPILPSPRYLPLDEIQADQNGYPAIDRQLFLLDCDLPEEELQDRYPALWHYLELGKRTVANGYLCKSRSPWYSQEKRPESLFLCTYMGRSRGKRCAAFRFILNHSKATAANVYLMLYPKADLRRALEGKPELAGEIWKRLNAIPPNTVEGEGRVYGGGLHKVEPRELGNVPAKSIADLANITVRKRPVQLELHPIDQEAQHLEFAT